MNRCAPAKKIDLASFSALLLTLLMLLATPIAAQAQSLPIPPGLPEVEWETAIPPAQGPPQRFSTPVEACIAQRMAWNPQATDLPPEQVSWQRWQCNWTTTPVFSPRPSRVAARCPEGFTLSPVGGGACLNEFSVGVISDCSQSVAGSPHPATPNPICLSSGSKKFAESDFTTADGLFSVDRHYHSRIRDSNISATKETPGFGKHWHGVVPGMIAVGGTYSEKIEYLDVKGGFARFTVTGGSPSDYNLWTFATHGMSRRSVSMTPTPAVDRAAFFRTQPSVPNGAAELVMTMANGDTVAFRRAGSYNAGDNVRYMVPIEWKQASGYTRWYDYTGTNHYPDKVRDSFNREMLLTWASDGLNEMVLSGIALPDGTTLAYGYGSTRGTDGLTRSDRLESVQRKSASGTVLWARTYLYENTAFRHGVTGIKDQNGAQISKVVYGTSGFPESSELANGVNKYIVSHEYLTANPRITLRTVTNPLGLQTKFTFNRHTASSIDRRLEQVEGFATATVPAETSNYYYSSLAGQRFHLNGIIDARGFATALANDTANRRPLTITEASGNAAARATTYTWHATLDLPLSIARPGLFESFTYSASGQMLTHTATDTTTHSVPYSTVGQVRTTSYSWSPQGRLLSINGPLAAVGSVDDITSFTYDAAGNLLTITNPLGHVTSFAGYDGAGRPGTMTDPNMVVTQYTYDALGRATRIAIKHPTTPALDEFTDFEYDIEGRVTGITTLNTVKLIIDYDLAGRTTAIRSADGERIDFTLDAMGNVTAQTVKRTNGTTANNITRTFDSLGRMLTETLGPGRTTTWAYDQLGNPTQIVTPRNNATTQAFDPLNRLVSAIAPDTGSEITAYDVRDNVTAFTDPLTVTTSFVRNGFGEVIRETSPDRGTSTYYYDAAGRMTASIDGRGQRVDYVRDVLGRVTSKTPLGLAAQAVTYAWDAPGLAGSYGVGRLSTMTDASGTTRFRYDHRGLMIIKEQVIGTSATARLTYAYAGTNRISQITYPSGRVVNYTRDTKGRVTGITTRANATATPVTLMSGGVYEPFGALKSASLGNGLVLEQDWGNDARLAGKKLRTAGGASLSHLTYAYDDDDNITGITDVVDATKNVTYAYDVNGRLSRMDTAVGTPRRTDYLHDKGGNRTSVEYRALPGDANPASSDSYTRTTGTNRLASIATPAGARSISYDARGNTSAETRPAGISVTTGYDGYGRLTGYTRTGDPTQANVYNGMDDRVAVTSGGTTRRYVFDQDGRVMGEYGTSATDVIAEFIWLSPEVGDGSAFGGDDGVGGYAPLVVASGPVATPTLLWVHGNHLGVPQVYTNASGTITTPGAWQLPGFPGQSRTFADLYYNRYRDYDPSTGRYIQADPIGLDGDTNPYVYAGANPLTGIDPEGLRVQVQVHPVRGPNPQARPLNLPQGPLFETPQWRPPSNARPIRVAGRQGSVSSGYIQARQADAVGICLTPGQPGYPHQQGIYRFPDQIRNDGSQYVGQSGNMPSRLAQHVRSGRLQLGTGSTMPVSGGRTQREVAEYLAIQSITGGVRASNSDAVSNQREPIGRVRRSKMGLPEPQ